MTDITDATNNLGGAVFAPSSSSNVDGFEPGNLICGGDNGFIGQSRRCTIINGNNNTIYGCYNHHIIGDSLLSSRQYFDKDNLFIVNSSGGIKCTGDVVAYRRSDRRLKDNVLAIKNSTKLIQNLKPVSFVWNDKQETYIGKDIGLIAQQVEKTIPEIVINRKNGYKAIDYKKIIPFLVESIKEKQIKINQLNEIINGAI